MNEPSTVLAVSDIHKARKFYEDLFDLKVYQNYGINISFAGGLSLQQEFDQIMGVPKESILKKSHNRELYFEKEDFEGFVQRLKAYPGVKFLTDVTEMPWGQRGIRFYDLDEHLIEVGESLVAVIHRFLDQGLTLEETSRRMDVSMQDLQTLLNE